MGRHDEEGFDLRDYHLVIKIATKTYQDPIIKGAWLAHAHEAKPEIQAVVDWNDSSASLRGFCIGLLIAKDKLLREQRDQTGTRVVIDRTEKGVSGWVNTVCGAFANPPHWLREWREFMNGHETLKGKIGAQKDKTIEYLAPHKLPGERIIFLEEDAEISSGTLKSVSKESLCFIASQLEDELIKTQDKKGGVNQWVKLVNVTEPSPEPESRPEGSWKKFKLLIDKSDPEEYNRKLAALAELADLGIVIEEIKEEEK